MAYYNVNFSCGHTERVNLIGKTSERERRIAYFEKCGECSECYRSNRKAKENQQNKEDGLELVEMKYGEYKEKYSSCKTEYDSYNPEKKTIKVWVSQKSDEDLEPDGTIETGLRIANATIRNLSEQHSGDKDASRVVDILKGEIDYYENQAKKRETTNDNEKEFATSTFLRKEHIRKEFKKKYDSLKQIKASIAGAKIILSKLRMKYANDEKAQEAIQKIEDSLLSNEKSLHRKIIGPKEAKKYTKILSQEGLEMMLNNIMKE